ANDYCGGNMKGRVATTRIPVKTTRNNPDIPDMNQNCATKEKQSWKTGKQAEDYKIQGRYP
ncbi:MAG: hypothetical protein L0K89_03780, partial [Bifidobacterium crudilactis]|nr:hypothetical protein [Bifidobacterium crudilactis]